MSNCRAKFNWKLFFERTWVSFLMFLIWSLESTLEHDAVGVVWAAAVCLVMIPAAVYLWTRRSPG